MGTLEMQMGGSGLQMACFFARLASPELFLRKRTRGTQLLTGRTDNGSQQRGG
jgi:hypothetical protein